MASKRPKTVAEYIQKAPPQSQPHLRRLYAILKKVAPKAKETIKWGNPLFVDPRFVFAFSAHKAHVNFAPTAASLAAFKKDLKDHPTTKHFLQIPYAQPFPSSLIRKIAVHRLRHMGDSDGFW
ncbi:MAG: hypothetical protein FD126_1068 [Elusimicrobia bacterium]|nr:MAG: hypothetical protein FD126_1068 [Elusimicrobiota bacterium]